MRLNQQLDRELALAAMQARLDEWECHLAAQSLVEALRKETHFEIEQVVRTPGASSRRVRSSVHLAHGADGTVTGARLNIERDGEAIFEWHLPLSEDPYLASSETSLSRGVFIVTNSALTAIMLHAATIDNLIGEAARASDIRSSCGHIASNARRAWRALSVSGEPASSTE